MEELFHGFPLLGIQPGLLFAHPQSLIRIAFVRAQQDEMAEMHRRGRQSCREQQEPVSEPAFSSWGCLEVCSVPVDEVRGSSSDRFGLKSLEMSGFCQLSAWP